MQILFENTQKFITSIGDKFPELSETEKIYLSGWGFQTVISKLKE